MRRRDFIFPAGAAAAWPFAAGAQSNGCFPVIGYLHTLTEADDRRLGYGAAFREGLRDRGYVVGENLRIEARYGDRKFDLLSGGLIVGRPTFPRAVRG
jgi:putative tryptophan/tyrosine transport system substrate-binding protein